jgi:hypothetical protein
LRTMPLICAEFCTPVHVLGLTRPLRWSGPVARRGFTLWCNQDKPCPGLQCSNGGAGSGLYVSAVVMLQGLLRALSGRESQLAVVALFNPLRHRIQSFIHRRFYRRKHDARKTLEAFSDRLRDETELDALSENLVGRQLLADRTVALRDGA